MIRRLLGCSLFLLLASSVVLAQPVPYPPAKVSFDDFKGLVAQVEPHRAKRLVDFDTFLKMSKEPGTIILDTRSDFRFERLHLKDAVHLGFTDFTQGNLARVIPGLNTRILIYCNNNFEGNQTDFASKIADINSFKTAEPRKASTNALGTQFNEQAKPIMMALNIPTYVNLFGYGYRNVYELGELVNVDDPRIEFAGTVAKKR